MGIPMIPMAAEMMKQSKDFKITTLIRFATRSSQWRSNWFPQQHATQILREILYFNLTIAWKDFSVTTPNNHSVSDVLIMLFVSCAFAENFFLGNNFLADTNAL